MNRLRVLCLFASGLLVFGCGKDIVSDSAKLDRHLIPALAFAKQRDHARAMSAVERLETEWGVFRKNHYGFGDSTWKAVFDEVDTMIADAAAVVDGGEYITDAYQSLDDMRMVLFELREDHDIVYFVDPLHEFQEPLNDMVRSIANRKPKELGPEDLDRLRDLQVEAREIWLDMMDVEFDIGQYGLEESEADSIQLLVGSMDYAISRLGGVLETEDKADAIRAVREVEARFEELYGVFGEFGVTVQ
jgi:hypothetical protein